MDYGDFYFKLVKSIHIISMVSYFAGLFYIVRIFIYHSETKNLEGERRLILQEQFQLMSRKLWCIITVPAGILTILTGLSLLLTNWDSFFKHQTWIHVKLVLVLGLIIYHFSCSRIYKELQSGEIKHSSLKLRMWNEIATLFLVSIVLVVILKQDFIESWHNILGGFLVFAIVIMMIVRLVKNLKK